MSHAPCETPSHFPSESTVSSNLRDQLQVLHERLRQSTAVDAESRRLLGALLEDINRLLEQTERTDEEERGIAERLEDLAVRFEVEHPTVGNALRQVVDALAKAGI